MFLTKTQTPIIGWVAILLGFIMNGIFIAQSAIGLDNIGLCIILFTIVIYMLMTPLTIQQQKFSRLSAKMQPELQAVQKKYKGKQDQASMAKMNEETQAIYAKYGVNPMGSCLQMAIQLPILFALYRVIWNIPAYVDKVKNAFMPLVNELLVAGGAEEFMSEAAGSLNVSFKEMTDLTLIDTLYKFKPDNWAALAEKFPDLSETIASTQKQVDHMNYFLGLNIADSPLNIMTSAWKSGAILLLIGAIMVPLLAALSQWVSAKLMSNMSGNAAGAAGDSTAATMNTMNNVMPIMSAVFCLSLPVGLGIYWIAGAVVRSVQQVVINKKVDKIDIDELAKQNMEKLNKKRAKEGLSPEKMKSNASMNTRKVNVNTKSEQMIKNENLQKSASRISDDAGSTRNRKVKEGSIASKAMMVQDYNEAHRKK